MHDNACTPFIDFLGRINVETVCRTFKALFTTLTCALTIQILHITGACTHKEWTMAIYGVPSILLLLLLLVSLSSVSPSYCTCIFLILSYQAKCIIENFGNTCTVYVYRYIIYNVIFLPPQGETVYKVTTILVCILAVNLI